MTRCHLFALPTYEVTDEPHAHKYASFPAHSTVSDEELFVNVSVTLNAGK